MAELPIAPAFVAPGSGRKRRKISTEERLTLRDSSEQLRKQFGEDHVFKGVFDSLIAVYDACKANSENDNERTVKFVCDELNPLTVPSIGIEGSEKPTMGAITALHRCISLLKEAKIERPIDAELEGTEEVKRFLKSILDGNTSLLEAKLKDLVESKLRFVFRKLFNRPVVRRQSQTDSYRAKDSIVKLTISENAGSYGENFEDLATIVRDALVEFGEKLHLFEEWKANDKSQRDASSERLHDLSNFAKAFGFLTHVFLEHHVDLKNVPHSELARDYRDCAAIVEEFDCMKPHRPYVLPARPDFNIMLVGLKAPVERLCAWILENTPPPPRKMRTRKKTDPEKERPLAFPRLFGSNHSNVCSICLLVVREYNEGGEVCCDDCMRWFHLNCLGLPRRFARKQKFFSCPACTKEARVVASQDPAQTSAPATNLSRLRSP